MDNSQMLKSAVKLTGIWNEDNVAANVSQSSLKLWLWLNPITATSFHGLDHIITARI